MNPSAFLDFIISAARFIILLGVLVFVHELGHFIVAKLSNVYVVRLSLGFGKRLFGFKRGETDYCISAIPLGGYVKMVGQEDMPKTQEEAELADPEIRNVPPERRFDTQPFWKKVAISLAGPFMNLVFALPVLWLVFTIGLNIPISIQHTRIGSVETDSPAERAGIKPGERILSINGDPVDDWEHVQLDILTSNAKPLDMQLEHLSGKVTQVRVIPVRKQNSSRVTIGIEPLDSYAVAQIMPGSPGERAGLKVGDLILSYDDKPTDNETMENFFKAIHKSPDQPVTLTVLRNGHTTNVTVVPEEVLGIVGVEFHRNLVAKVDRNEVSPVALAMILRPGDTVTAVNGVPVQTDNVEDMLASQIRSHGEEPLKLTIKKEAGWLEKPVEINIRVTPAPIGRIGVIFSGSVFKQYGPGESFVKSFGAYGDSFALTVKSIYYLVTGKVSTREMAGPIGMAVFTTQYWKLGISHYLNLVAILTINLGILNVLPIPMLDGGLILLTVIELVRRKPLEEKHLILFQRIGMAFLLFLVLYVTYNDILRVINLILGRGFME